jgi:hypothetical protein
MFKADGAMGGTADKIGGPLAKDGAIGWVNSFPSFSFSDGDSGGCEELEREWRKKGGRDWEIGEWVEVLLEVVPFVG